MRDLLPTVRNSSVAFSPIFENRHTIAHHQPLTPLTVTACWPWQGQARPKGRPEGANGPHSSLAGELGHSPWKPDWSVIRRNTVVFGTPQG